MDDELLDEQGRPVVFYYSRERRLAKASQALRSFNEASPPRKTGLLRTLTATKSSTFLLVSIVILCIALIVFSRFSFGSVKTLEHNQVKLQAASFEGVSYITIQKTAFDGAYTGAVDITVSIDQDSGPETRRGFSSLFRTASIQSSAENALLVESRQIFFTPETEETFRFSIPFTGKKIFIFMEAGPDRIILPVIPRNL